MFATTAVPCCPTLLASLHAQPGCPLLEHIASFPLPTLAARLLRHTSCLNASQPLPHNPCITPSSPAPKPQLLAPPSHAITPAEFYQLWQALPHRAQVGVGAGRAGGMEWRGCSKLACVDGRDAQLHRVPNTSTSASHISEQPGQPPFA